MNDETNPAPQEPTPPPVFESEFPPCVSPLAALPPPKLLSYWLKKLLVCNPFYLASAALLLYGVYRISMDVNFFATEVKQLIFNFSALQIYELLLAGTATLLVTRRIWYDSSLLVVLENMLWIVPFILVSQAAFINQSTGVLLCALAVALAVSRMAWLTTRAQAIGPASRGLLCGLPILLVNAAWPILYRHFQETKVGINIAAGAAYVTNELNWFWLFPMLAALLLLVPRAESHPAGSQMRRWFPLLLFAFWLVGTGVHLYALGYVYDFKLRREQLAPVLWVLAWAMQTRFTDLVAAPSVSQRKALLFLPVLAIVPAAFVVESRVGFYLNALNLLAYAIQWLLRMNGRLVSHLAVFSFAALVASLPLDFAPVTVTVVTQTNLIGFAALAYLIVAVALSRNPKVAILGAVAAMIAGGGLRQSQPDWFFWAAQSGLGYFLLHSLRWTDGEHVGARSGRWFVAVVWVGQTFFSVRTGATFPQTLLVAGVVLAGWASRGLILKRWQPMALPLAAGLVALCSPANFVIMKTQSAPAGLLYVVGSFALFGIGTLVALTKHRWHKHHQP